jgi:endonuclease/exonuclease/phosphatase family metal-dependent hydrolase
MRLLKRSVTALLPALTGILLLAAAPAQANHEDKDQGNSKSVTVMTWNLYFGFDDGPVVAAALSGDPALVVEAATEAWRQVHATDFHRRVRDIALHVRLHAPDLIGVQEAVRYVETSPTGAIVETLDHLEILVAALRELGLPYEVVSSVDGTAVDLPVLDADGNLAAVSLQDRNAILARANHGKVAVSNPQHGTYQFILGPPDFPFPLPQGWASVDVAAPGHRFRFVTTRLEDPSPDPATLTPLQEAQALELVNIHLASGLPVVFAGDFNTDGFRKWPTYRLLTGELGLTDAWKATHHGAPGLTWGQSPDLLNRVPKFTQRLDLVLFSGRVRVTDADVIGNTRLDRAAAGMWPSDHAGLVVTLIP